eukprot:350500-Chlamydomonas_euryale.AAC.12
MAWPGWPSRQTILEILLWDKITPKTFPHCTAAKLKGLKCNLFIKFKYSLRGDAAAEGANPYASAASHARAAADPSVAAAEVFIGEAAAENRGTGFFDAAGTTVVGGATHPHQLGRQFTDQPQPAINAAAGYLNMDAAANALTLPETLELAQLDPLQQSSSAAMLGQVPVDFSSMAGLAPDLEQMEDTVPEVLQAIQDVHGRHRKSFALRTSEHGFSDSSWLENLLSDGGAAGEQVIECTCTVACGCIDICAAGHLLLPSFPVSVLTRAHSVRSVSGLAECSRPAEVQAQPPPSQWWSIMANARFGPCRILQKIEHVLGRFESVQKYNGLAGLNMSTDPKP